MLVPSVTFLRFYRADLQRERDGGNGGTDSTANALLQEAENRLRHAEERHERAEQREAEIAELEKALSASRAELSRREKVVSAEGVARASPQNRSSFAAVNKDDHPPSLSGLADRQQDPPTAAAAAATATAGISLGVSEGQGWAALGSPIPEASSSSHGAGLSWGGTAGGPGDSRGTGTSAAMMAGSGGQVEGGSRADVDVAARERQLKVWSDALAEQAKAMREQALRLETAYAELREKEAESLSRHQESGREGRGDGDTDSVSAKDEMAHAGGAPKDSTAARHMPQEAVVHGSGYDESLLSENRQIEQETVRLAEKARELDAERRRLKLASESADRDHARVQAERQEASAARRDAAALRVELERQRTRLDAEKGELTAERSLLAAERGRLATERARSRREEEDVAARSAAEARKAAQERSETMAAARRTAMQDIAGDSGDVGESESATATRFAQVSDSGFARAEEEARREKERKEEEPARAEATLVPATAAVGGFMRGEADPRRLPDPAGGGETHAAESGSTVIDDANIGYPHPPRTGATSERASNQVFSRPDQVNISRGECTSVRPSAQGQQPVESATPAVRRLSSDLVHDSDLTGPKPFGRGSPSTVPEGLTRHNSGVASGRTEAIDDAGAMTDSPRISEVEQSRRGGDAGRQVKTPTVDSVRRRLHGGGGRRGNAGTADELVSSDEDSPLAAAKPARRGPGAAAVRTSINTIRHSTVPEDPFLAQLHARLAGADHTLRQSLGRRQALLNRFGGDGSSVAPTSEGDTSDQNAHSAPSLDASPEATASSSGDRRGVPETDTRGGRRDVVAGDLRLGIESSPETDTRGGRFGFTGAGRTPPGSRGAGGEGVKRRQSRRALTTVVSASESAISGPGAGSPRREISESTSTPERQSEGGAAAAVGHTPRRNTGAGNRRGEYGRTAGSDTDDTEAEKENLRELMLALGAVDMREEGSGEGDADVNDDDRNLAAGAGVVAGDSDGHLDQGQGIDGDASATAAATGEADAGGGDTLMSSLRAQNEDISSRLQDMSLQVGA